jgi:acyl-coenzyme A thioesterase PaaI-like protein
VSSRQALLQESGPKIKEDTKTQPCLLFNALLDIGEQMSGFEGTLHGGATALFIDEAMGSVAGGKSPFAVSLKLARYQEGQLKLTQPWYGIDKAVTVQINTNFRKTINLPQVLLVRARMVKKEGRKIYVRASIENKDGECSRLSKPAHG